MFDSQHKNPWCDGILIAKSRFCSVVPQFLGYVGVFAEVFSSPKAWFRRCKTNPIYTPAKKQKIFGIYTLVFCGTRNKPLFLKLFIYLYNNIIYIKQRLTYPPPDPHTSSIVILLSSSIFGTNGTSGTKPTPLHREYSLRTPSKTDLI